MPHLFEPIKRFFDNASSDFNDEKLNLLKQQEIRQEAFMYSVPIHYCGWSENGEQAISPGFEHFIRKEEIQDLTDLLGVFSQQSADQLEDAYQGLLNQQKEFKITLLCSDEKRSLCVRGSWGSNFTDDQTFYMLWFEDVSDQESKKTSQAQEIENLKIQNSLCSEAINALPFPVWARDKDGNIMNVNKDYQGVVGDDEKAIIEQQKEILQEKSKTLALKAMQKQQPQSVKDYIVVDGQRHFVEICEIPNSGVGCIGYVRDLTDVETLEAELKRLGNANKEILEQLSTPVAVFSSDTKIEFYNSAYSTLWGLSESWLNTKPTISAVFDKMRENRLLPEQSDYRQYVDSWKERFTSIIEAEEEMMYLPNGTVLRTVVVPHPGSGLMVTHEDVTSRLELESSFKTLTAVQRETIDHLAEGVSVFGADGRLKLYNESYKRIWDLTDDDLGGNPHITDLVEMVESYFKKEEWQETKKRLIDSCLARDSKSGRFTRAEGTILDYNLVPLPDGALLCSYVDVTDTARVEKALRDKNLALEEAEKLKSGFLANVSYQLRTPLNAMMGFADILDQQYFGPMNEKQLEYTKDMITAGKNLVSLIDDILDLSTIEAGYLKLHKTSIKMVDIFADVQNLVEDWARKESVQIEFKCPKNIGSIDADESRVKQVLMNLIQNAINFTPEKGTILVQASKKKDNIEIVVEDTGSGISAEELETIFQPFVRAQKTTRKRGAGIGLSLVKSIVELHGGDIEIESELDKGTKILCRFPKNS